MSQQTAVVVGAGPGLGWAIALRFAQAGMRTIIAARDQGKLDALIAQSDDAIAPRARFEAHACDATVPEEVAALFSRFEQDRVAYYQLHLQPRSAWTHELDLRPWTEKF